MFTTLAIAASLAQAAPAGSNSVNMSKRRRTDLRSFGGIADATLVALFGRLRDDPTLLSSCPAERRQFARIDERAYNEEVGLEINLSMTTGPDFLWHAADPVRLIRYYCKHSIAFRGLMADAASTLPADHVYKLVIYYDEATPGALLRLDNRRKFWSFYCSCLEFGHRLHQSDAWVTFGILRSNIAKNVEGKLAAVFAKLIEKLAPSMCAQGVAVDLPGVGPRIIRLSIHNNLGDEAALKRCLDVKGSAGVVPCIKCKNVMYNRAEGVTDADGYVVTLACTDPSKFDARADEEVWAAADDLDARFHRETKKDFAESEKVVGINRNLASPLFRAACREIFRPISSLTFDSMHVWFSNGCANEELYMYMEQLGSIGVTWKVVADWFRSDFCYPKGDMGKKMRSLHTAFNEVKRNASKNSKEFKGQASDILGIVPMLNHFVESVVESVPSAVRIANATRSFHRLAKVVSLLQQCKRVQDARSLVPELQDSIVKHFEAYTSAYGSESATWKRHATLHIADQIMRDGRLLDSFPLERKHQLPKQSAEPIKNTSAFEKTVLIKAIQAQLHNLNRQPDMFKDSIQGDQGVQHGMTFGTAVSWQGEMYHQGDIVLLENPLAGGVVEFAASSSGRFSLYLTPLRLVRAQAGSSTWRRSDTGEPGEVHVMSHARQLRVATAWYDNSDQTVTIIA